MTKPMKKLVLAIAAFAAMVFGARAALPVATGADLEYRLADGSAKVFVWNTTNELGTIEFIEDTVADVLVVGGGGGGGGREGGGGGGGGVVYSQQVTIPAGTYTVTVGAGGVGGAGASSTGNTGTSGGNSSLSGVNYSIEAIGGGYGAALSPSKTTPTSAYWAASGGCGGGGSYYQPAGAGAEGQGYAGGDPVNASAMFSSGGGGAGEVGHQGVIGVEKDLTQPFRGGDGGSGRECLITGESVFYGGGGGGGVRTTDNTGRTNWNIAFPGLGGLGGGGNGGGGNLGEGLVVTIDDRSNEFQQPGAGVDGLGGGGGGGYAQVYYKPEGTFLHNYGSGAPGGCGTVIVRVAVEAGITVNLGGTILNGDAPATVSLAAQVSTDNPDETVEYQWDFESDGIYDATTSEPTTTHVYATAGEYTTMVKVVELTGNQREATATCSFTIGPIYVDANAPADGDGYSWATAFQTIPEGIAHANACSVLVKGGSDRVYTINSEATSLVIPEGKANLTIKAVDGHATINVPIGTEIFTNNVPYLLIGEHANGVTVSGLDFIVNCNGNNVDQRASVPPCSVAEDGKIIVVKGDDATFDDCSIIVRGGYPKRGWYGIFCPGESSGASTGDGLGLRLKVRNCTFSGFYCASFSAVPVVPAYDPQIVGNIFTNCTHFYRTAKSTDAFLFVSNVLVECSQGLNSCATYDNSARNAEIAYNIFKTSKPDITFFKKEFRGMSAAKIHHNTVIGCDALIDLGPSKWNGGAPWTAQVFDNVLVANEGGALVKETWTFTQAGYTTMFADGSFVRNNAFYCPNGGLTNVSTVANHDFAGKVVFTDNIELDTAPVFMSVAPGDPNFCRAKQADNPAWGGKGKAWTDGGAYPDYIGAVAPGMSGGLLIIVR